MQVDYQYIRKFVLNSKFKNFGGLMRTFFKGIVEIND